MAKIGSGEGFLYGHVDGERFAIHNTADQISAFIMKYRFQRVMITDIFDVAEIEAMGFINYCSDQEFLREKLLPTIVPMQQGQSEIIEFKPYVVYYSDEELKAELIDMGYDLTDEDGNYSSSTLSELAVYERFQWDDSLNKWKKEM